MRVFFLFLLERDFNHLIYRSATDLVRELDPEKGLASTLRGVDEFDELGDITSAASRDNAPRRRVKLQPEPLGDRNTHNKLRDVGLVAVCEACERRVQRRVVVRVIDGHYSHDPVALVNDFLIGL